MCEQKALTDAGRADQRESRSARDPRRNPGLECPPYRCLFGTILEPRSAVSRRRIVARRAHTAEYLPYAVARWALYRCLVVSVVRRCEGHETKAVAGRAVITSAHLTRSDALAQIGRPCAVATCVVIPGPVTVLARINPHGSTPRRPRPPVNPPRIDREPPTMGRGTAVSPALPTLHAALTRRVASPAVRV